MDEPREANRDARLRRAAGRELLELVADRGPELSLRELRLVLRNPFVTAEVIDELLGARRLLASYEARSAIARHHRADPTAAQGLLPGLFWRDLLAVSLEVRIRPRVRRTAEKILIERLPRLATGEKISLARRATREVLFHLRRDPDPRVIAALLENPRLTEEVVLAIAGDPDARPRILDRVAAVPHWSRRYRVRHALCLNPGSPYRVIFDLLPGLKRPDVEAVAAVEAHSSIVRRRARELLEAPI